MEIRRGVTLVDNGRTTDDGRNVKIELEFWKQNSQLFPLRAYFKVLRQKVPYFSVSRQKVAYCNILRQKVPYFNILRQKSTEQNNAEASLSLSLPFPLSVLHFLGTPFPRSTNFRVMSRFEPTPHFMPFCLINSQDLFPPKGLKWDLTSSREIFFPSLPFNISTH